MLNLGQINAMTAKAFATEGRIVYSTAAVAKPTIMDLFKAQLLKPKVVNKHVSAFRKQAAPQKEYAENLLKVEAEKEGLSVFVMGRKAGESQQAYKARLDSAQGLDVFISARVKGQQSSFDKIKNGVSKMRNFDGPLDAESQKKYDESHKIINYFLMEKPLKQKYKGLIGDQLGLRYIQNKETVGGKNVTDTITSNLSSLHGKDQISLRQYENYKGRGIKPYTTEQRAGHVTDLRYIDENGNVKNVIYAETVKPLGYTRINADAKINSVNTEIQIGGNHTTDFGDVEHVLYDIRSNKSLDMSGLSKEQKALAKEVAKEYKKVLENKELYGRYNDYLPEIWNASRTAEGNQSLLACAPVPSGLSEVLSHESLLKLAHK